MNRTNAQSWFLMGIGGFAKKIYPYTTILWQSFVLGAALCMICIFLIAFASGGQVLIDVNYLGEMWLELILIIVFMIIGIANMILGVLK